MKMNPVVHFELPATDTKRMAKFYGAAFGWQLDVMGADMGGYVVAKTTKSDPKTGRPTEPGAINGGFYDRKRAKGEQHPSFVIAVDDMEEAMAQVKKAGGTIVDKPSEVPGVGTYVNFVDTEGNRLSLLQPSPMM